MIFDNRDIYDNCDYYWQFWQFSQQKDNNSNKDTDSDNTGTYDIWDTDYNSDNWEPEFMTIFVIWQLIVTLDSIRNSCDVLEISKDNKLKAICAGLAVGCGEYIWQEQSLTIPLERRSLLEGCK